MPESMTATVTPAPVAIGQAADTSSSLSWYWSARTASSSVSGAARAGAAFTPAPISPAAAAAAKRTVARRRAFGAAVTDSDAFLY